MSTKKQIKQSVQKMGGKIKDQKSFYITAILPNSTAGRGVYDEIGDILEKQQALFLCTHCVASGAHNGDCFLYVYYNRLNESYIISLGCSALTFGQFAEQVVEAMGETPDGQSVH